MTRTEQLSKSSFYRELRPFVPGMWGVAIVSFFVSLSYLAIPIYFEQIQDRVMTGRNITTLTLLTLITLFMLASFSVMDWARRGVLRRMADALDQRLNARIFDRLNSQSSAAAGPTQGLLIDLESVREFLGGRTILAVFDAVWTPLLFLALYLIHPGYALLALALVGVAAVLLVIAARLTKDDRDHQEKAALVKQQLSNSVLKDADTLRVLGMIPALSGRWRVMHQDNLGWQQVVERVNTIMHVAVTFVRYGQPVFVQALGAYLFLYNEASAASVMATTMLIYRIVGPLDGVILQWDQLVRARKAMMRLDEFLQQEGDAERKVSLPRPEGPLSVSRLSLAPPGAKELVLHDVSFRVLPGRILGVAGPSGAGKSCLSRALVGVWRPQRGMVAIGEHDISHWNSDELGQHVGYVPQEIVLLPGTLAENISRFDPREEGRSERLLAACGLAGILELVQGLPDGLNSRVAEAGGWMMSAGQLQRIALARALYGNPYLLVMDEPNSNLDAMGEQALVDAMMRLRELGAIIVVVSHKTSLLRVCDDIVVMAGGAVHIFGTRDDVFSSVARSRSTLLSQQAT